MTWLQLLADDRGAAELEAHRSELLLAGADPVRTETEAGWALRIHARLGERRRHAVELAALNELARRLATLRDPQAVLGEVAAQARRLLAVDVAYLMLRQSDALLRIEVVDGSIGAALRGIELAVGQGLGGEVLRTGRPMGTEDYLADHGLPHAADVDAAALSEHLGGILGVPLRTGAGTIGVLCAADRRPRRFTPREIELLAALGSHAAVAIGNARLFEENRHALADLERANAALRRSEEARREADALRDRLTAAVLRRGGAAAIAAELERALGVAVAVFDADGVRLTGRGPRLDELVGTPPGESAAERSAREGPAPQGSTPQGSTPQGSTPQGSTPQGSAPQGSAPARVTGPAGPVVVAPVELPTGRAGCLVAHRAVSGPEAEREAGLDEDAERVLALGATAMALVVASERTAAEAELRTRGEFLVALLSPESDEGAVRRRARAARVDVGRISAVAVLSPAAPSPAVPSPDGPSPGGLPAGGTGDGNDGLAGDDPRAAAAHGARVAAALRGWSAEHAGEVVVLVPGTAPELLRDRLATGLPADVAAGVADCAGGVSGVRSAHENARQAAAVLHALGRTGRPTLAGELGIYRTLFSRAGRGEGRAFVETTLGPLLGHDRDHGRDLVATLRAYLDHGEHHARTCEALHVHANTLYRRLDRITALLGAGWRAPDRLLEIRLALHLDALLARL
ncbi:GAF domain-containing protein [Pseudonocardia sp. RS11V-5]|uniref:helix-turn-helix domain-containing protein n=1 Tax=Pseudonocardia terrae TaxID=2905831 RepID=UPI001E4ED38A|nr:GAF domain-containing protein [Pseudonocardia terrae]MCE3551609.1 GAF domain-containing protein [Pseudonocardia terrae]